MPVYRAPGAILPMQAIVQYTGEIRREDLKLRFISGTDATEVV